ncbi:hypothetical protein BH20ACI2_BH20ACI2_11930 [soil metagenome]
MELLSDGSFSLHDTITVNGKGVSPFVIGAGWLLEIIELRSGDLYFISDDVEVRSRFPRFGIFYPPFTIIRMCVNNLKATMVGIGAIEPIKELPDLPVIFETDFDAPFNTATQAAEILTSSRNFQSIEMNSKASLLSIKAKRVIDENYHVYPSIARIALRLNVAHEHLSRQFKLDYEMSPSAYLHRLRMAEATFKLLRGDAIIDVSGEVGYNDLGRFYNQFRKQTKTSPGNCRIKSTSKNAKTL